jgi:hypothetical protein
LGSTLLSQNSTILHLTFATLQNREFRTHRNVREESPRSGICSHSLADYAELPHGRNQARQPQNSATRHNPAYGIMAHFVHKHEMRERQLREISVAGMRY